MEGRVCRQSSKDIDRFIQVTIFKLEALERWQKRLSKAMSARWTRIFEGVQSAVLTSLSGDDHLEIDPRSVQWFVDPLNPGEPTGSRP